MNNLTRHRTVFFTERNNISPGFPRILQLHMTTNFCRFRTAHHLAQAHVPNSAVFHPQPKPAFPPIFPPKLPDLNPYFSCHNSLIPPLAPCQLISLKQKNKFPPIRHIPYICIVFDEWSCSAYKKKLQAGYAKNILQSKQSGLKGSGMDLQHERKVALHQSR